MELLYSIAKTAEIKSFGGISLCFALKYPGSFEKILFDWLVKNVDKTNDELHKMVICNRKLRNILLEDWLIGVVGEKRVVENLHLLKK